MKIKVLHIAPNFNYSCGVSKHIFLLLKNYSLSDSLEFHFITNGGDSLERLDELNISYKIVKFSSGIKNILHFFSFFFIVRKYCKKNKIDIIHTHHRFPEFLSHIISKSLNIKTVTTAHSFVTNFKSFSYKSDKIIAVSSFIRKSIQESYRIEKDRIIVLYNFVETLKPYNSKHVEQLRAELDISLDDKVLLFIGRISKIKGIDILINVFNELRSKEKKLKLILVGENQNNIEIEKYQENNSAIKILKPQNKIENFYKIADIIILPARMDPFPYIMLEAALAEKPIIASNVGGIPEFIINNKNGLLFNPNNPDELTSAISELLTNRICSEKLVSNNKNKIQKFLDKETYYQNLLSIYKNLLYIK